MKCMNDVFGPDDETCELAKGHTPSARLIGPVERLCMPVNRVTTAFHGTDHSKKVTREKKFSRMMRREEFDAQGCPYPRTFFTRPVPIYRWL